MRNLIKVCLACCRYRMPTTKYSGGRSYQRDRAIAKKRFGIRKIRPQESSLEFFLFRVDLNYESIQRLPTHPNIGQVMNWKLTGDNLVVRNYNFDRNAEWISTLPQLQQMILELGSCDDMSIDFEMDNEYSYLGMICLMQITSINKNYFIDCLALYDYIGVNLVNLFMNPKTLKLVHGTADITAMQRDFGLHFVGLINCQEAFAMYDPTVREVSLSTMVEKLFGEILSKADRAAEWRLRPLPYNLYSYAVSYSRQLFRC